MPNKIKIQHYVPRFYLKSFAIKKEKEFLTNCFDKPTSKTFLENIRKIASERYFYDLVEDNNQDTEKELSKHESKFSIAYYKLINLEDLESLTEEDKTYLAYFIASQMVRTKESRIGFLDVVKQIKARFSKDKLSDEFRKEIEDAEREESVKRVHISSLTNVPQYASILLKMKWVLFKNRTEMPLWTSDNPVTFYNPINLFPYGNLGLTCKGIQIHFPLNPKLSLCICDPERYKNLPHKHDTTDTQNIIFQNCLQVNQSTRHIFSISDEFTLAKEMITENPNLKDTNRKRTQVT